MDSVEPGKDIALSVKSPGGSSTALFAIYDTMQFLKSDADLEIHARGIARQRRRVEEILAEHTGQAFDRVHDDTERDFILGPHEAVSYGIVDDPSRAMSWWALRPPVALQPQEPLGTSRV